MHGSKAIRSKHSVKLTPGRAKEIFQGHLRPQAGAHGILKRPQPDPLTVVFGLVQGSDLPSEIVGEGVAGQPDVIGEVADRSAVTGDQPPENPVDYDRDGSRGPNLHVLQILDMDGR